MRAFADRGVLDLIAILAEHSTHPDAAQIANELEMRVVVILGACRDEELRGYVLPRLDRVVYGAGEVCDE